MNKYNELTAEEERVIIHKGTEMPFTGKYYKHKETGSYLCRRCDAVLFTSEHKFESNCGWPSFDDAVPGAVKQVPDADGRRTEILCSNCGGHLGHVFFGEGFTSKDVRHCVNSVSLNFVPEKGVPNTETAIFASGCFWGTEYHFQKAKGVLSTQVGYTGGHKENPTYGEVCSGRTGHAEAVKVVFDPSQTTFKDLTKLFFETHDFTQVNRQGPDIGEQYRSGIFYTDSKQKKIAEKLVKVLSEKGFKPATEITEAGIFWEAEDYHQNYYEIKGGTPYCHIYRKIFE